MTSRKQENRFANSGVAVRGDGGVAGEGRSVGPQVQLPESVVSLGGELEPFFWMR